MRKFRDKDILLFDIGNTSITFGVCDKQGRIIYFRKFRTSDWGKMLLFLGAKIKDSKVAFIVSVVPVLTLKISKALVKISRHLKIYQVGKDVKIALKNNYKKPQALGKDRLLNAFYVKEKVGFPAVCVNVGTAVTIDLISEKGEFEGGLIFPGFRLCLEALTEKTALLPLVKPFVVSKYGIGRTTEECINIGVIAGISSLIDRVTEKYSKIYSKNLNKVITGGDVILIEKELRNEFKFISELTLNALCLLAAKKLKKIRNID